MKTKFIFIIYFFYCCIFSYGIDFSLSTNIMYNQVDYNKKIRNITEFDIEVKDFDFSLQFPINFVYLDNIETISALYLDNVNIGIGFSLKDNTNIKHNVSFICGLPINKTTNDNLWDYTSNEKAYIFTGYYSLFYKEDPIIVTSQIGVGYKLSDKEPENLFNNLYVPFIITCNFVVNNKIALITENSVTWANNMLLCSVTAGISFFKKSILIYPYIVFSNNGKQTSSSLGVKVQYDFGR